MLPVRSCAQSNWRGVIGSMASGLIVGTAAQDKPSFRRVIKRDEDTCRAIAVAILTLILAEMREKPEGVDPMSLLHQAKVGLVWLVVATMVVVFVLL
jgi:hypothetical protein